MITAVLGVSVPLAPGQEEHGHGAGVCLMDGSGDFANIRENMVIYLQNYIEETSSFTSTNVKLRILYRFDIHLTVT